MVNWFMWRYGCITWWQACLECVNCSSIVYESVLRPFLWNILFLGFFFSEECKISLYEENSYFMGFFGMSLLWAWMQCMSWEPWQWRVTNNKILFCKEGSKYYLNHVCGMKSGMYVQIFFLFRHVCFSICIPLRANYLLLTFTRVLLW